MGVVAVIVSASAALLAWATFAAWYWVRARWWESPEGRNVMGVSLTLCAALLLVITSQPHDWPRVLVCLALAGLAVQRTVQLERAQRRKRD